MLRGVKEQKVQISHIRSVKHAGWTLENGTWAVMILGDASELVYVHQLIQYDGWIKKSRDGQEECAHDSGHVFLKCFRFTFQQLRVKKDANMLKVQESRSALTPTKSIHANLNANHNAR